MLEPTCVSCGSVSIPACFCQTRLPTRLNTGLVKVCFRSCVRTRRLFTGCPAIEAGVAPEFTLHQLCAKRSVPKAHNVKAQGNALGTCETKDQSPKGAKSSCIPITPFQGFHVRYCRFLGRCPRLSHCAALRQTAPATRSVPTEQIPDNFRRPHEPDFCARQSHPANRAVSQIGQPCRSITAGQ